LLQVSSHGRGILVSRRHGPRGLVSATRPATIVDAQPQEIVTVKSHTPHECSIEQATELSQLRAEVRRVLSADEPNVPALMAALDRVDAMLRVACEDLAAAMRELFEQQAMDPPPAA
jgi:hypothetical protein